MPMTVTGKFVATLTSLTGVCAVAFLPASLSPDLPITCPCALNS